MSEQVCERTDFSALPHLALPDDVADYERVAVTGAGQQLAEEHPEVMAAFVNETPQLIDKGNLEWKRAHYVGIGSIAQVYSLPGHPDYCVKVAHPLSGKSNNDIDPRNRRPLNLFTDLRVMDAINRRLESRPEHDVHSPEHYAGLAYHGPEYRGFAILQQRVPQGLTFIGKYFEENGLSPEARKVVAGQLDERLMAALGLSASRLCINDFMIAKRGFQAGKMNYRNTFIEADKPLEDSAMHVIDLLRGNGMRRRLIKMLINT